MKKTQKTEVEYIHEFQRDLRMVLNTRGGFLTPIMRNALLKILHLFVEYRFDNCYMEWWRDTESPFGVPYLYFEREIEGVKIDIICSGWDGANLMIVGGPMFRLSSTSSRTHAYCFFTDDLFLNMEDAVKMFMTCTRLDQLKLKPLKVFPLREIDRQRNFKRNSQRTREPMDRM